MDWEHFHSYQNNCSLRFNHQSQNLRIAPPYSAFSYRCALDSYLYPYTHNKIFQLLSPPSIKNFQYLPNFPHYPNFPESNKESKTQEHILY